MEVVWFLKYFPNLDSCLLHFDHKSGGVQSGSTQLYICNSCTLSIHNVIEYRHCFKIIKGFRSEMRPRQGLWTKWNRFQCFFTNQGNLYSLPRKTTCRTISRLIHRNWSKSFTCTKWIYYYLKFILNYRRFHEHTFKVSKVHYTKAKSCESSKNYIWKTCLDKLYNKRKGLGSCR